MSIFANNKDVVVWVTPEETKPNFEKLINWSCPCIADAIENGPCRSAFAQSYWCFLSKRNNLEKCEQPFLETKRCFELNNIHAN